MCPGDLCEALEGLGYLIPFPLTRPSGFKTGTRLVLPLYEQSMVEKCRRVVEARAGQRRSAERVSCSSKLIRCLDAIMPSTRRWKKTQQR